MAGKPPGVIKLLFITKIMKVIKNILLIGLVTALAAGAAFAQSTGSIAGSVTDSLGAVLVGATVTVVSPKGNQKTAITNARGE